MRHAMDIPFSDDSFAEVAPTGYIPIGQIEDPTDWSNCFDVPEFELENHLLSIGVTVSGQVIIAACLLNTDTSFNQVESETIPAVLARYADSL